MQMKMDQHYWKIQERINMLVKGEVEDDECETPMSQDDLIEKLSTLIYNANELCFRMGMALGDLEIHSDNYPPAMTDFTWSMDDLNIPTV